MSVAGSSSVLQKLRGLMGDAKYVGTALQAYIIPTEDAHQSEYIAKCDERRAFICGFDGSRGMAIVSTAKAAMWTDGRYFLQAERQLGPDWTLMKESIAGTPTQTQWLSAELKPGDRVGFDPRLMATDVYDAYKGELDDKEIALVPVDQNLVDLVWGAGRPTPPLNPIVPLGVEYAGMASEEKLGQLRDRMATNNAFLLVLSALDEIAWLFNLRGSDIEYNPVFTAYAVIPLTGAVTLYVDMPGRSSKAASDVLSKAGVRVEPYAAVFEALADMARSKDIGPGCVIDPTQKKVWLVGGSSVAVALPFHPKAVVSKLSPVAFLKAVKNATEREGMRQAHIKDAVAHCQFSRWLEAEMAVARGAEGPPAPKKGKKGTKGPSGPMTELSAAEKFLGFRAAQKDFVGLSFTTISSTGPNAAMCHYNPTPESNATVSPDAIYLVDSGGQYLDGTTDVTRTYAFREPTAWEKACYTRVLKGHIALASLVFPEDMSGYRLDSIARVPLWKAGLEYRHGTGHGVGHYLNVHEGPAGFHFRSHCSEGIKEGMVLTIEPGYYEAGAFGIRIENEYVLEAAAFPEQQAGPNGTKFLKFVPLTWVPIATNLIERGMLNDEEVSWVNEYHSECLKIVGPRLKEQGLNEEVEWLMRSTVAI